MPCRDWGIENVNPWSRKPRISKRGACASEKLEGAGEFAEPLPTLRQPFADLSLTFRRPFAILFFFASLSLQPPLSMFLKH